MITVESLGKDIIYGASGITEVIQNVRTLLTTRKGTVPIDRKFGLSFEFLDDPLPTSRAKIQTEIFQAIKKYEPRAVLKQITFDIDPMVGRLAPTVKIEVRL